MKKSVKIKLTTTIRQPGSDEQVMELRAEGVLTEKGGRRYLQYEERQDELDIRTTVKLGEQDAVVMRSGGLQMRLPFLLDKEQTGNLRNGEGSFMLTTKAHELVVTESRFRVRYDLALGNDYVGEYEMEIQFMEGTK
ncbi:DUF1934 domain-containing protein [Planococcus dechangensis]|uniref:DUF1934 domain-containing protein n=1 Tax=Planococcus dechangensis TaxID=1176255 RepID=A0ABV9MER2_9BACL